MPKRILKGKVIKNKCDKTIIVDVESTYMHKKYKKILKKNKKFAVHDENNVAKIGDRVVVLGAGPIGLICIQVLKAMGVSSIIVSECYHEFLKLKKLNFGANNATIFFSIIFKFFIPF